MRQPPSPSVMLTGTDQPVEPPRLLTAGKLTAELESGNLRYIRYDGIEMIRAVSFIVRDKNWGTYDPAISNLAVSETRDGFTVTYDAVTRDAAQQFALFRGDHRRCRRASSISSPRAKRSPIS